MLMILYSVLMIMNLLAVINRVNNPHNNQHKFHYNKENQPNIIGIGKN